MRLVSLASPSILCAFRSAWKCIPVPCRSEEACVWASNACSCRHSSCACWWTTACSFNSNTPTATANKTHRNRNRSNREVTRNHLSGKQVLSCRICALMRTCYCLWSSQSSVCGFLLSECAMLMQSLSSRSTRLCSRCCPALSPSGSSQQHARHSELWKPSVPYHRPWA